MPLKTAMVFAAGLGTRLKPLTLDRPKALVKLGQETLLEITIRRLESFGIERIVVNVHHFADLVEGFLQANKWNAEILLSDERELLRETGGGLQHAATLLGDDPFLVHNVDILSDLDLRELYDQHTLSGNLATLAVRNRPSSRKLLFSHDGQLCGWKHMQTGETRWAIHTPSAQAKAFSGIHIIDPKIFSLMTRSGKFSIIDTYLSLAPSQPVKAYDHSDGIWMDVGKYKDMDQANKLYKQLQ